MPAISADVPGRVVERRARLGLQRALGDQVGGARRAEPLDDEPDDAGVLLPLQPARHLQQLAQGDRLAGITGGPLRPRWVLVEAEHAVADEHADDCRREALGHRVRAHHLIGSVARVVALVHELAAVDDDDRLHPTAGVRRSERGGDGGVDGRLIDACRQRPGRPVGAWERHAGRLRRVGARGRLRRGGASRHARRRGGRRSGVRRHGRRGRRRGGAVVVVTARDGRDQEDRCRRQPQGRSLHPSHPTGEASTRTVAPRAPMPGPCPSQAAVRILVLRLPGAIDGRAR